MIKEIPIRLSEALYLAAEVARKNEELEKEVEQLRLSKTKEVLQGPDIVELLGIGPSTLSQWVQDPTFPHLMGDWQKGMLIRCRTVELYQWLKSRKSIDIDRTFNVRRIKRGTA